MKKYLVLIIILLIFSSEGILSQTLSVNDGFLNDYYRRQQLLGNIDPSISFTNRPLYSEVLGVENIYNPNNTLSHTRNAKFGGKFTFHKGKGKFQLLPINLLNQYNSHHPEGINDGSMIPSRGTQLLASAGFYLEYGPLSIKFKPEFVYAQNKDFDDFPSNQTSSTGVIFPDSPYGYIDLPERYGVNAYNKFFWGQSSIRLKLGPISLGLSNENLWWGPGYRNSLLMTNSASGFMHLTINTVKPIKTILGSFEYQIIGGRLEDSGHTYGLSSDWRYINALVFSYQPKWVPGLFLGATRSLLIYNMDMGKGIGDYLTVFIPLAKSSLGSEEEVNSNRRNQLISIFMRWLFRESNAEIYFEYGRDDHAWDSRDFILEPSHSSGYIIGFRKLFKLQNKSDTHLQLILELSNLATNQTTINRHNGNSIGFWYQNTAVRHGYTHNGQLLGAGIGPGSNLQTIDISWNRSLKQIGIQVERYVHNNDFWFRYFKDFRANWVDISYMAYANWDFKNFILFGKMKFLKSYNYQWLYEPQYEDVPEYWAPSENTFNFHLQVGITYRF